MAKIVHQGKMVSSVLIGLLPLLIHVAAGVSPATLVPADVGVSAAGNGNVDTTVTANTKVKEDVCPKGESWCSSLDNNEILALEAIRCLHRQLDDDKDGNINLDESDEYLREELKYEKDYEKRQKAFHHNNDYQVSVRELWDTWVKSEVHNWTMEQTLEWLDFFVGLPQYQAVFIEYHINGTFLPRLAVNHHQFLSSIVGVKDIIHKQKISLKAQDVVLFGSPKDYTNHIKDMILTTLLGVAIIVCWFVYTRYKMSQRDLHKMIKDMESLAKAENELIALQKEMERNKLEQKEAKPLVETMNQGNSLNDSYPPTEEVSRLKNELDVLRGELQRAEVELQDKCWVPPTALQHWLQLTYELELKSYNKKKVSAERQLKLAKDACDKLKKKRSSLMGAFVSTHGRSIDDVDKAILESRTSLTEITHELQERMHRWKQIEILVNSPIMNNPGLQYLENTLRGYGRASSYGGAASVISNSQDDIDDDAASSIYCPSAVHKLAAASINASSYLMFPGPKNLPQFSSASNSSARLCNYQQSQCDLSSLQSASSMNPSFGGISTSCSNGFSRSSAQSFEQNITDKNLSPEISANTPHSQTCQYPMSLCPSGPDSDNAVSAPATTSSLPILRSKSVASMMSYREKAVRDLTIRDAEDEIASEASEMVVPGRDRRVTFGIRTDQRNGRVKSENYGKSGAPTLASSESDEVERKSEMKKFLTSNSNLVMIENIKISEECTENGNISLKPRHPDEPDLIKIPLGLPSAKSVCEDQNSVMVPNLITEEGKESITSEVKDKFGFWKSISKFVARSSESIVNHHRHYKVQEIEGSPSALELDNGSLSSGKVDKDVGKKTLPIPQEKKSQTRFLSSFRRAHKTKSSHI